MTSVSRPALLLTLTTLLTAAVSAQDSLVVGANVNMVSGASFPDGDPFQRQQNEPSVAFSSRNDLHLLAGANDYRAVDVPGLPGGRETGDSWLSYFWSTNGGGTWRSTLIPGYPQDPACQDPDPPTLCGYAAGADPVVRAGVNGMFYYSGIVFERSDPSRSAIFVSRFIDLNNDEGGEPIRYIDTVLLDTNDDGAVFLDKSWIGVDIPRAGSGSKVFNVVQRDGSQVAQTVGCGNLYVGYAAIGDDGTGLRSEIRMATSYDCGDTWATQLISQPDSLNQGANIAIDPLNGDVHVAWRRFDTVEAFLGIPAAGCPADPSSWEVNDNWPTSTVTVGDQQYTVEEAKEILTTKHKGDETYKVAYVVIAAQLNLLTGGGDPVPGFNPVQWGQNLTNLIADANAWLTLHPLGSDPKQADKHEGLVIKEAMQEILLGSGTCSGSGGTSGGTTGETNAILYTSSDDGGASFTAPVEIHESSTFDQGSTTFSFRTTAYPTITVDASSPSARVYVAWSARGFATQRPGIDDGDARIVLSTSTDGFNWSAPYAVDDDPNDQGHQIKPSLLFAGGQLTLVYYDFRNDVSAIFDRFVVDLPEPDRARHTVDVRLATALPDAQPLFTDYLLNQPSQQASRYAFITGDSSDPLFDGESIQIQFMPPNLPMFADGTTPFVGDYVDIAAPNLVFEDNGGSGIWRFATNLGDVTVWQAVWADNRDVIPPPDGDWSKYVAPITQSQTSIFDPTVTLEPCDLVSFPDAPAGQQDGSLYTGTRNQNVYSATITKGLIVAAPGNNRPLVLDQFGAPLERGFVVYVQNSTEVERTFELTLLPPAGIDASFDATQELLTKQVVISPYSSAATTVFAALSGGGAVTSPIPVSVVEVGGALSGSVLLNSDPTAPDPLTIAGGTSLLDAEVHNPAILNPAILNPAILNPSADPSLCTSDPALCLQNPAILNPAILNPAIFNPAILNPAIFNPAILNPAILNPAIFNPAILNPAILNPAIFNPAIFNPAILNPAILNPAIMNPAILNPAILNPAILNPAILNPAILNPAILNPAILNSATGSDSQQVDVTFTVTNDGNATTAFDLNLEAPQLAGLDYELIVYRLNETPTTDGCTLTTEAQQQLIFNQSDPLNNPIDGSFYLEPGEQVFVTFRVLPETDPSVTPGDPLNDFDVADLSGQVTSQPANTGPVPQPPLDQFGFGLPASLWRAEGDALDSVGSNDGTLQNGAGFATGRIGQAFSFNNVALGSDQYMQVPDDPTLRMTTAMTMSAWINPTSAGEGPNPIVLNKEGEYELSRRADGSIEWAFGPPTGSWVWFQGAPPGSAPLNTWTHVAVTFDNGTVSTYVNGAPVSTLAAQSTVIGDYNPPLNELWIGARAGVADRGLDGRIDEVRIYNTALTPNEVLDLYNAAPSPFTQYTDETAFLNASGSTAQVVFPAPDQGFGTLSSVCNANPVPDYVENGFTLRHACGFGYSTGDLTANLAGREFAVSGAEQVDITMPIDFLSFGIRIEDGNTSSSGCAAADSSFTLAFKDGNTLVGQIQIDPPTGQGSFIGVTSTIPFDNVEIREVGAPVDQFVGAFCENDYFGTIFAAGPSSTFDSDADGWTIVNDGGGWVAAGGNPGGYMEGLDSGGATNSTAWYFGAPAEFTGDQSAYYGGELRYDLQQSDAAPDPAAIINQQPWVVLVGAGLTLVYDGLVSGGLPGTTWTPFTVPLDAADPRWHLAVDGCWTQSVLSPTVCNFSGAAPTLAQFLSVLGNLDTLLIRGEYSLTLDVGGLDNAKLVEGVAAPLVVDFDRPFAAPISTEYVDQGVMFGSSNCTSCSAYLCSECSPSSASGPDYLAVNSSGPEAVLTAEFVHPLTLAPISATDVSVYINDTEFSVGIQAFDLNGVLVDSCANVFSGCSAAVVSGNRVLVTFAGPIAELRFTDSGGDGHVIDDLTYIPFGQ